MKELEVMDAQTLLYHPLEKPKFILDGLIPSGLSLFCGSQKIGKSWLMERLSDDNYQRLMGKCQAEQKDFKEQKAKLDCIRNEVSDLRTDSEKFVALVEEYGNITELSQEVLNMLIDRIAVHTPSPVDGVMHQQIDVYYRYVGSIRVVDYGSTTYYKHGAVSESARKRESCMMEKRIAATKDEIASDVSKSA